MPSQKTRSELEKLDVHIVCEDMNREFRYHGPSNKIYACEFIEKNYDFESIIFFDSDTVVVGSNLLQMIGHPCDSGQIGLQAVNYRGVGTNGNDENEKLWKAVFKTLGVKWEEIPVVNTIVDNVQILGYWNAGLIYSYRAEEFFSRWKKNHKKISKLNFKGQAQYFLDQISLSGTAMQSRAMLKQLPLGVNYPIPFHQEILGSKIQNSAQLALLHHYGLLKEALYNLKPFIDEGNYTWLKNHIFDLKICGSFWSRAKDYYYRHKIKCLQKYFYQTSKLRCL